MCGILDTLGSGRCPSAGWAQTARYREFWLRRRGGDGDELQGERRAAGFKTWSACWKKRRSTARPASATPRHAQRAFGRERASPSTARGALRSCTSIIKTQALRRWLEQEAIFRSQTDTEVVSHLLAYCWRETEANRAGCRALLSGSFMTRRALRACRKRSAAQPGQPRWSSAFQRAKRSSPGYSGAACTRDVLLLEDGSLRWSGRLRCFNAFGQPIDRKRHRRLAGASADLGGTHTT